MVTEAWEALCCTLAHTATDTLASYFLETHTRGQINTNIQTLDTERADEKWPLHNKSIPAQEVRIGHL